MRSNVCYEWARAADSLKAVDALVEKGLWADAVSRAYYGAFYLARALLFSMGLEARSHGGLVHMLSVHLVREGSFPAELLRMFSKMQKLREDADYETAIVFDEQAAKEAKSNLLQFRAAVEELLRARGRLS